MSPSDLLRETGLTLSIRQFRRHLPKIEGVKKGKGGHYYICGPVTADRINRIRTQIEKLMRQPAKRWKSRAQIGNPSRKAGVLTIEGIMVDLGLWLRTVDVTAMDSDTLAQLLTVLQPISDTYLVAARLIQERATPENASVRYFQAPAQP